MKEVVVVSGKGGTGKTSIVGSIAALAEDKVLADCDVDAADLHLLLNPTIRQQNEFWSSQVAVIDDGKCTECGLCQDICRFDAISGFKVNPIFCEGCGFCSRICPDEAITMKDRLSGDWFISETRYGPLVHAKLGIGEGNSGKLVAIVRQEARAIAEKENFKYIVTDGPPGIGCPVISSLSGATAALLVTEPTLSAIHDLERVLGVCHHFSVPAMVCINKCDLNDENVRDIETFCSRQGVDIVSRIPMDNVFIESLVRGLPVVEYSKNGVSTILASLWDTVSNKLDSL